MDYQTVIYWLIVVVLYVVLGICLYLARKVKMYEDEIKELKALLDKTPANETCREGCCTTKA